MQGSKIIDFTSYKRNNSNTNSSVEITLDTIGPSVDIDSSLSYTEGTALFYFKNFSPDSIDYKTWGDYDTTPTGINYDLCGDTEANAPWVIDRESIEYSLGNISPAVQHLFNFKFRDDVYNEMEYTVIGKYEPTVLIDVSDLVMSKEQYFTFMLDNDAGVIDTNYFMNTRSFDTFTYIDWVSDGADHRPNAVFGKDGLTSKEFTSLLFIADDKGSHADQTITMLPKLAEDINITDHGNVDVDVLMRDAAKLTIGINFNLADIGDKFSSKDNNLINASMSDAAGPYGVFHYFAVYIQEDVDSKENISFSQYASDYIDYTEELRQSMFLSDSAKYFVKPWSDARILQRDYFPAKELVSTNISITDDFISNTQVLPKMFSQDDSSEIVRPWVDIDHITGDSCSSLDKMVLHIPFDFFGYSEETGIINSAYKDLGTVPVPKWELDVNLFDIIRSKESLYTSVEATDNIILIENDAVINITGKDFGITPEPRWEFVVNAIEDAYGKESITHSLLGSNEVNINESILNNVLVNGRYSGFERAWSNVDQLMYDIAYVAEKQVLSIPLDYISTTVDLGIVHSAINEIGYVPNPIWKLELNSFDRINSNESTINSVVVSDCIYFIENDGIINITGKDFAATPDPKWEFVVNAFDAAEGKEVIENSLLGTDSVSVDELPLVSVSVSNKLNGIERGWVNVDHILYDYGYIKESQIFHVPLNYFTATIESGLVHLVSTDDGLSPNPVWKLEINSFDNFIGKENLITSLLGAESVYFIENDVIINITGSDIGVSPDPKWEFVVNAFETAVGTEILANSLMGSDLIIPDESIITNVIVDTKIKGSDIGWFDADQLMYDTGYVSGKTITLIPFDYFGIITESGVVHAQTVDYGYSPVPVWKLEINSFDNFIGKENLYNSILGSDYIYLIENDGMINITGTDIGFSPDPKWEFVVNAFEIVDSNELIENSLLGVDTVSLDESIINTVLTNQKIHGGERVWADVDQTMYEFGFVKDTFINQIPLDYFGGTIESGIAHLISDDFGYSPIPTWKLEINSFEKTYIKEDILASLLASEYVYFIENGAVINITGKDFGITPEPRWEFVVNAFEVVNTKELIDNSLLGTEIISIDEESVNSVLVNNKLFGTDLGWADVDQLMYDTGYVSGGSYFDVIIQDDYITYDSVVIDLFYDDLGKYSDKIIFEKVILDSGESSFSALLNLSGTDEGEISEFGVVSVFTDDFGEIKAKADFEKRLFDISTGKDVVKTELITSEAINSISDVVLIIPETIIKVGKDFKASIDVDLIQIDYGEGIESSGLIIPANVSYTVIEDSVITLAEWDHSKATFVVTITKDTPDFVYKYAFDFGEGIEVKTTIENRSTDPSIGIEVPVISVFTQDYTEISDVLKTFEKYYKEQFFGIDSNPYISLISDDYGTVVIYLCNSLFGADEVTYSDLLTKFSKLSKYYGIGTDVIYPIELYGSDNGLINTSVIVSTFIYDFAIVSDKLVEFSKNTFETGRGVDRKSLMIPISDFGVIDESAVNNLYSTLNVKGFDNLIEFSKDIFEAGVIKDTKLVSQEMSDAGESYSDAVINAYLSEIGDVTARVYFTELIKVKEHFKEIARTWITTLGQEFLYTNETAMLLPCVFDVGTGFERQTTVHYIKQYDDRVAFESSAITVTGFDEAILRSDVVIQINKSDIGIAEFNYDIDTGKVRYIKALDFAYYKESRAMLGLLVNDFAVLSNEYVILTVAAEDIAKVYETNRSSREIKLEEIGVYCVNTVVYDPEIAARDLMYWWDVNYMPGGDKSTPIKNPDWGKDIVPGDIDYPYYKGDSHYGEIIPVTLIDKYADYSCEMTKFYKYYGKVWYEAYEQYRYGKIEQPEFQLHIDNLEVIESYLVTTYYIPWVLNISISVEVYRPGADYLIWPLRKNIPNIKKEIISQYWDDDNYRYTTYGIKSANNTDVINIDCEELFKEYSYKYESGDYAVIEYYFYARWDTYSSEYERDGYIHINVTTETGSVSENYKKYRRQFVYTPDQWFVPTDVLYYEPQKFKLYINMGCGPNQAIERAPENALEKFILDKMTRYSKLNIDMFFLGDHADIYEDPIISLNKKIYIHSSEVPSVSTYLFFWDTGYTCEDIVVYSISDFQDRELMYWWEKGYPVADYQKDSAINEQLKLVPSDLLGEDIRPGDFDYPYNVGDSHYGEIIKPKWLTKQKIKAANGLNVGYHNPDYWNPPGYRDFYYPLLDLCDGAEFTISGKALFEFGIHFSCYFAAWGSNTYMPYNQYYWDYHKEDLPYNTKVYKIRRLFYLSDIYYDPVKQIIIPKNEEFNIKIKPKRVQEYVKSLISQNSGHDFQYFYYGYFITIGAQVDPNRGSDLYFKGSFSSNILYNSYDEFYNKTRSFGMYPNDGELVTKDFYPDFFGFKLYVNLGCGPDVTDFPIEPVDDFEAWVFRKARKGDVNRDYLYAGDEEHYLETPVIELLELWEIDVIFRVMFNEYEFTVTDSGILDYAMKQMLLSSDESILVETTPVIEIPESFGYHTSYNIKNQVTMKLHESGEFAINSLFDLFTSDTNTSFIETPVIWHETNEDTNIDFAISFKCVVTLHESALSVGQGLLVIPVDDVFISDEDTTITLPLIEDVTEKELPSTVEILFQYDKGDVETDPLVTNPVENIYKIFAESVVNVALAYLSRVRERIWPDRKEVYRDIGYVCFWVQIVVYPYVIDWLAGHFVDYYNEAVIADYYRFTSCFGIPPGDWPPVSNYPGQEIIPRNHPRKDDPEYHDPEYNWKPTPGGGGPGPSGENEHGYRPIPGPGGTNYIIDPVNPPEPYEWIGGTSLFIEKYIYDKDMEKLVLVVDAFYFALFDEDNNRVSKVQKMTFKDTKTSNTEITPGAWYGAMVFFDLEPDVTYYVKETDSNGNILHAKFTSEATGNKYLLPANECKVTTIAEKCVDAGRFINLLLEFGKKDNDPIIGGGDDYIPIIYPYPGDLPDPPPERPRPGPFVLPIPDLPGPPPPYPLPPYVGPPGPPVVPPPPIYPGPPGPPHPPIITPGYEGKLNTVKDNGYIFKTAVITVPVEMLSFIWEYHYIPATFILELSGMKIEWLDGFEIEIEEPFRFDFEGFGFEVEEPFKLDESGFEIVVDNEFSFDEDWFVLQYTQDIFIDEVVFEFEAQFEDFQFDWEDYDGQQITPAPDVVAEIITYDGQPHKLCHPKGTYGTVLYKVGDDSWSTDIPERTEAGSYEVYWYAMASLEYTGYGSEQDYHVTYCAIRRATPEIDLFNTSVEYNTTQTVTFIYTGDGEVSCVPEDSSLCECEIVSQEKLLSGESSNDRYKVTMNVTGKSCGPTKIHVKTDQGDNYFSSDNIIECAVTEATLQYIAMPVVMEYTGEIPQSNIIVYGPERYTIYYSPTVLSSIAANNHREIDFYTAVGNYTVYFVIYAKNYKPSYGKFRLTITLIQQHIVIEPFAEAYDEQPHPLITSVTGAVGTMWYSTDKETWSADIPVATLPGRYKVYWYCVGDENHYDEGTSLYPNEIEAVIKKRDIIIYLDDVVIDMSDPEPVVVHIPTQSHGRIIITCSDYTSFTAELSGLDIIITPIMVGGGYVNVRQLEDEFYGECNINFHVEIKDTRIFYTVQPVVVDYTGEYVLKTGVVVTYPKSYEIWYSKVPIPPAPALSPTPDFYKDAGQYKIYFMIAATGHTTVYDSFDLIINKVPNNVTVDPVIVDYDGSLHDLVDIKSEYFGTMYYSMNAEFWVRSIPQAVYAGRYPVYWYLGGDRNHTDVGSLERPFKVISKIVDKSRPITVTGKVVNALTGQGIENAIVKIRMGDSTSGAVDVIVRSNAQGEYTTQLYKTDYIAEVTCEGYLDSTFNFEVISESIQITPFALVPVVDRVIIVLTWGDKPDDMDSYLQRTDSYGKTPFLINYSHKKHEEDGELIAELDVDATTGFGPETMSIYDISGEFVYYVKDFAKTSFDANALVRIYTPGSVNPVEVKFDYPIGEHDWVVCKIVNGVITIINELQ